MDNIATNTCAPHMTTKSGNYAVGEYELQEDPDALQRLK
jgi:hypothetical protein